MNEYRLKNFPINVLAIVLGLAGFTLALQKSFPLFTSIKFYVPFLYLTILSAITVVVIYTIKSIKFPNETKKEFTHPIKINFFPIIAKVFLILSVIYLDINIILSKYLFFIGAVLQIGFSVLLLSIWIKHDHDWKNLNPSWFIPIVGNVIVPITGVAHGFVELSWFFFAIGLIMWLTLFIIVFNRIIFHHPLPKKLIPTMFILFAPPAIAFIAYIKITGSFDAFARVLYYGSAFLALVIFLQVRQYSKLPFFISWWAYTFPTAALTVATTLMFHESGLIFFKFLVVGLMVLLTFILGLTLFKTIQSINGREICIEED